MARGAGLRGGRDRGRAYALGIGRAAGLGLRIDGTVPCARA